MKWMQPIRSTVQNTGYWDAPGTHWALLQHKKHPGRNEEYSNGNKEKFIRNQQ